MMQELKDTKAAINPTDTLLVVDAMTGQEAANLVKAFNDQANISGTVTSGYRFGHSKRTAGRHRWWHEEKKMAGNVAGKFDLSSAGSLCFKNLQQRVVCSVHLQTAACKSGSDAYDVRQHKSFLPSNLYLPVEI